MIFGEFVLEQAEGVTLAHTLILDEKTLKKGTILGREEVALLRRAGFTAVTGARLEPDDLPEGEGARAVATLLAGPHTEARKPYTGRSNVHATVRGVVRLDAARLHQLNAIDESITVGTLPDYALARPGQVIATIKIIPFAVSRKLVERCRELAGDTPLVQVVPFQPHRVGLIMGEQPGLNEKIYRNTVIATHSRIEALGSRLALVLRCAHECGAYQAKLQEALAAGCDLVMIAGATVTKDRLDVAPAAVTAAGGEIIHFGMPVEPGNMLLFARLGAVPVLVLPGCARSRRLNGLDWILHRLLSGLPMGAAEIMEMGVGGLIRSPLEPDDEEDDNESLPLATRTSKVAALVLAAGRSSRMGTNKLLTPVEGVPMLLRAVNAALASQAAMVTVVLGHEAGAAEALLAGRTVSVVHNADFAQGLSSSLRAGLAALPLEAEAALILLADMPCISARHLDRLIEAHQARPDAIIVPRQGGRRGNPVLWPRAFFVPMQQVTGDQGAREVLEANAARVHFVEFDDDAIFLDVDTPDALRGLHAR